MKTIFRPGFAVLAILVAVSQAKAEQDANPAADNTSARPTQPAASAPATPAAPAARPSVASTPAAPAARPSVAATPAAPAARPSVAATPAAPAARPQATATTESIFTRMTGEGEDAKKVVDVMLESKVNRAALKATLEYFDKNQAKFSNRRYITLIDYSKPSNEKRMYVFEVKTGKVQMYLVSHGMGSGGLKANTFSNKGSSGTSSLGFYRASETYVGKHGRSMRLDGLSSTNSAARRRAVVVHAAGYIRLGGSKVAYVSPEMVRATGRLGRSQGCPALDPRVAQIVIEELRGGSLMYVFNK